MKSYNETSAANDEFQNANNGLQNGELVRDLLEHRLQVPVLQKDRLVRPELDQTLLAAIGPRRLVFLEAPAGYGKSHALASALQPEDHFKVRWVTLNTGDNAPSRFLAILASALGQQEVTAGPGGSFEDHLAMLLLKRQRNPPIQNDVLILDNLHHLTNPAVVGLLHQLAIQVPDSLSLVMVSRLPVPFETHTLELAGRYLRLAADTLEFTRPETFEFFRQARSQTLITSVAIDHLYNLTEGWPTPLALYRQEIQRQGDLRPLHEAPSVERFLKDGVMAGVSPGHLKKLRVIAELDTCSDDLLQAIEPELLPSQTMDRGLPVRLVPGRGRWFRLNPLLQAWLQTPVMVGYRNRMLLASRWFAERRQLPEALKYALLAGDNEEVIRIASEGTEALLLGQDTASLLTLRKSLPPGLLERSARLRIVYGWVHAIGGQFRQARALLENFSARDRQEHQARIYALKAFILRGEGLVEPALEMADKALAEGQLSTQAQLVTQIVRSSALCAAGQFQQARDANRIAAKLAREAGDSGSEALAVYAHARIELGKGALSHAEQLLRTGLDTAMQELSRPARIGETRLQLNLVLVLWHKGRLHEADRLLVTCARHAEQARDLGLLLAMALRVLMCRAQGRLDDAFVWIGRAERTMHTWQVDESLYLPVLEALKASCWLACGQVDSASQAIARLGSFRQGSCVPELFPMMPGLLDCLQVRTDLANRDLVRARSNLQAVCQRYGEALPWGVKLHVDLLDAVLQFEDKNLTTARKQLETIIREAAREDFISPFAELMHELRPLMEKTWPGLKPNHFTGALGELFALERGSSSTNTLSEPISEREQGVLGLIAEGLSNQDIADKLHISLHTVKTHARRINAKLGVKSRTQAIVRARDLGLL